MNSESEALTPLKNLVLIGFMGCGKSAIGRKLSERLNYPLFDTDHLVEEQQGRKIKTIFEQDGEAHFRQLETAVLQSLVGNGEKKQIIATGGGIINQPANFLLLKELGFVVWLDAKPETILERISRNTDRPLLNCENPEERIRSLGAERRPLYEQASHLRIETDGLDFDEITTGIIESARYYFGTQ